MHYHPCDTRLPCDMRYTPYQPRVEPLSLPMTCDMLGCPSSETLYLPSNTQPLAPTALASGMPAYL